MTGHVTIKSKPEPSAIGTVVVIDGVEVPRLKNLTLTHRAGELPTLTLEILPRTVTFEGGVEVNAISVCPACHAKSEEYMENFRVLRSNCERAGVEHTVYEERKQ